VKKRKRTNGRFWLGLSASLLLILVGILMTVRVFSRYGQTFMGIQDDYLLRLAQSVDRNICNLMERYEDSIEYLVGRPEFIQARKDWQESGKSDELLRQLRGSALNKDELIEAVLLLEEGRVALSTDGRLDYALLTGDEGGSLRPCTGKDGDICLAVVREAEDGLTCAALMDLDRFYEKLAVPDFSEQNWILLTDTRCQVLLYQQQSQAYVDRVDAVTGATSGQEGVEILLESQNKQKVHMTSYEYFDPGTHERYTARMAVVPSQQGENGAFAVGVVANFEAESAALNFSVFQLMIYGGMLVAGILCLVILFAFVRRKDERELRILREKNAQMEELTRKTQELAHHQRLETIGTLTSSIAHEFNNLLTPIMGYSIMVMEQLAPEQEELYDNLLEIYQASQKAKTIITRLSDLSRKNTGLSYQYISPGELARKVLDVAAPARPAKVEVYMEQDFGQLWLYGNETQLSQMLLNLVLNGFHAMQEKEGVLTLSVSVQETRVLFRVKDTGSGIAPEVLSHVFEPFFTTKESGKGTGLGLAIVQQIVEEHKGSVEIESQVGQGTCVCIFLPGYEKPEGEIE